jgi:hypothetical protein
VVTESISPKWRENLNNVKCESSTTFTKRKREYLKEESTEIETNSKGKVVSVLN